MANIFFGLKVLAHIRSRTLASDSRVVERCIGKNKKRLFAESFFKVSNRYNF